MVRQQRSRGHVLTGQRRNRFRSQCLDNCTPLVSVTIWRHNRVAHNVHGNRTAELWILSFTFTHLNLPTLSVFILTQYVETRMNILALLVEFLGTFIFLSVIVATGSWWMIGAALAVVILLGGTISGGHFNPAVTIMTLYNRGIAPDSAAAYIVAQVLGGLAAISVYNRMQKSAGSF